MLIVEFDKFWTAVQHIIHLYDCEWGGWYNLKCITTLYKNLHLLLVHLWRLQTNDSEKKNNKINTNNDSR